MKVLEPTVYVQSFSSKGVTWSSPKISSFCGQEECTLLLTVNISFLRFEAYFLSRCLIAKIELSYKRVGRANVL
jgi:hypothetical protein